MKHSGWNDTVVEKASTRMTARGAMNACSGKKDRVMKHCWQFGVMLICSASISLLGQAPGAARVLPDAPAPDIKLSTKTNLLQVAANETPGAVPTLTRSQAEQMAIRNNPQITASKLLTLAQHEMVGEARAAYLPTITGDITAVRAHDGGRLSADYLSSPRLLTHAGAGADLSQLITDFGHTHNLILSQKLAEEASKANALATTEDIVMATDLAFYNTLNAQAVVDVAAQTVKTRQATETQIGQLTKNNLRSTLDESFADVNLSQAKLMQLDAQNNADAEMAALDAVLGLDHGVQYRLVDDVAPLNPPPPGEDALVQKALQQRPDLQALTYDQKSSEKYARAQWEQMLPTISANATAGSVPIHVDEYYTSNWWGAAAVNMNIPIFNGFLYSSQAKEAKFRAKATAEKSRDLRDRIVRDVHTAWLQANTDYQRLGVTAALVKQADMGLQLAQARYKLGLSSIVELSQAELQQTSAQIDNTEAEYRYRLSLTTLAYQIGTTP